jgi:hypothetical protein
MRYTFFIYSNPAKLAARSEAEIAAEMQAYGPYMGTMKVAGVLMGADHLQPVEAAKTVSMQTGEAVVTEGPAVSTTETLGGTIVVEAADMETALDWAAKCPSARSGRIEVRSARG